MQTETFGEQNKHLADQYGNSHCITEELARGGQGVVFRTKDVDIAIKQPLGEDGEPDKNSNLKEMFGSIRCLPLPPNIPISMPLAILKDEPGYVMRLLNGMEPFGAFDLSGDRKNKLSEAHIPEWLSGIPDKNMALALLHYSQSGSVRKRLFALYKCASILSRLHSAGLVYGDVSPNNGFIGAGALRDVWLIDADNLRYELVDGGNAVYTPRYGAPEIVRGLDRSRPRTDCWAFAVMAFETLALAHPFIGKKVLDPDSDSGGWDAEPIEEEAPADIDDQAYAGYLPFIDDVNDVSNEGMSGLPRQLVLTEALSNLFQETFCAGRLKPWRRPTMGYWALEFAKAYDRTLICPNCNMSYYDAESNCPYCKEAKPRFLRAITPRWKLTIQKGIEEVGLHHRLFHPFSHEHSDRIEYKVSVDWETGNVTHVRGTKRFPEELSFKFEGGQR